MHVARGVYGIGHRAIVHVARVGVGIRLLLLLLLLLVDIDQLLVGGRLVVLVLRVLIVRLLLVLLGENVNGAWRLLLFRASKVFLIGINDAVCVCVQYFFVSAHSFFFCANSILYV